MQQHADGIVLSFAEVGEPGPAKFGKDSGRQDKKLWAKHAKWHKPDAAGPEIRSRGTCQARSI